MTRTTHHHRRHAAALIAALGLATFAAPAVATDGAIYWRGASIWSARSPFAASWQQNAMQVRQATQATATAGNVWEMNWGCDVPGTEIAQVRFGALRTAAPSSLEVRVTGDRQRLWAVGDAALPQSPAGGRLHEVNLPGGQCNVHLALTQVETRVQHPRTYFIDAPSVALRDLTPPSVELTGLTGGWFGAAPRTLGVGWSVSDNFGSDGIAQQEILVGGVRVWAGAPGAGTHSVGVDVPAIPDGTHAVVVRAQGDGTGAGAASGTISVDRTAPVVGTAPPAHSGAARSVTLSWDTADATSGVASAQVQMAHAGGWSTLATSGGGAHARTVTVPAGIPDGVHAWRVVATDHAGNTAVAAGRGSIIVDTTSPTLAIHGAQPGWAPIAEADVTTGDNLAAALGMGGTEIDVNTAADGSPSGEWRRVHSRMHPAGRASIPIPLDGVADGSHRVRVTVRNGAPFSAHLAASATFVIRVDRTVPVIDSATFAQAGPGLMRASWTADDGASGIAHATVQWRDGATWRTLAHQPAGRGAGSLVADLTGVPTGPQRFRVMVADAAGNAAAGEGTLTVTRAEGRTSPDKAPDGAAAGATDRRADQADARARLRTARLQIGMAGAKVTRRADGRTVLVRTVGVGSRTPMAVRLTDAAGQPVAGADIEARGHRGALVARGRTGADGRVRLSLRPEAGAQLRVGVPVEGALLPARAEVDARVRVRPRVVLRRVTGPVRAGERVAFTGRVHPAPARLGLRSRKGVVLEWRDPLRGTWRPVVNAPLRRDGTFSIPWRFNLRGVAVPMRARVPAELGWPLMPARSRIITVVPR